MLRNNITASNASLKKIGLGFVKNKKREIILPHNFHKWAYHLLTLHDQKVVLIGISINEMSESHILIAFVASNAIPVIIVVQE